MYWCYRWRIWEALGRRPLSFFTARKRSLGQGNIFISVCQEFCPRGGGGGWVRGVHGPGGCMVPGVCMVPGGPWSRGGLVLGVHGPVGVPGGPPPDGYCCGRYVSYWNAFLFFLQFHAVFTENSKNNRLAHDPLCLCASRGKSWIRYHCLSFSRS